MLQPNLIPLTEKKLREARYFLELLQRSPQFAQQPIGEFDFLLSAFLSAARSVTFALQNEQKDAYDGWFPAWLDGLSESEQALLGYMKTQRNLTQKKGRPAMEQVLTLVAAKDMPDRERRVVDIMVSMSGPNQPPPMFWLPVRFFSFGTHLRPAEEVCEEYLYLLGQLVRAFSDHLATNPELVAPAQ